MCAKIKRLLKAEKKFLKIMVLTLIGMSYECKKNEHL